MKIHLVPCLLLLLSLLGSSAGSAWAQASWRDLPPEDRREMRQQMREHWQQDRNMRREEGPRRWQEVPPEDRRRLRDEMREQGRGQGDRDGRGGRGERGGRHD